MAIKTTGLGDLPRERIGQPDPVILPEPTGPFARRAERLRVLAEGHPMADWLRFLALIADAQNQAFGAVTPVAGATSEGMTGHPDTVSFDRILVPIIAVGDNPCIPDAARDVLSGLPRRDTIALAEAWLTGAMPAKLAGEAVPIAAALQVWYTRRAASLDVRQIHLLPRRGICPVCASSPVAGVVTAAGKAPGARYLHCSLCATAWNHVRATCVGCGSSKGLALQEVEGGNGAVKAETCDACHGYAKMFYQAKDMAIEPFADDLASLGLDLMVSDAGWSRLGATVFSP